MSFLALHYYFSCTTFLTVSLTGQKRFEPTFLFMFKIYLYYVTVPTYVFVLKYVIRIASKGLQGNSRKSMIVIY